MDKVSYNKGLINMTEAFRHTGKVINFYVDKGFGFVRSDQDGQDRYTDRGLMRTPGDLYVAEVVEFEAAEGSYGYGERAIDLVVIGTALDYRDGVNPYLDHTSVKK